MTRLINVNTLAIALVVSLTNVASAQHQGFSHGPMQSGNFSNKHFQSFSHPMRGKTHYYGTGGSATGERSTTRTYHWVEDHEPVQFGPQKKYIEVTEYEFKSPDVTRPRYRFTTGFPPKGLRPKCGTEIRFRDPGPKYWDRGPFGVGDQDDDGGRRPRQLDFDHDDYRGGQDNQDRGSRPDLFGG